MERTPAKPELSGITPETIEKLKDFKDLREFLTSLSIQEIRKGDDQGHFLRFPREYKQLADLIATNKDKFERSQSKKNYVFRFK